MKKMFLYLMMLAVLSQACKKDSTSPSAVTISTDINQKTTFGKLTGTGEVDYTVTVPVNINADVVIEPGVTIVFKNGADFTVTMAGSLNATGTMDSPITFKAEQNIKGFWGGLYFESTNLSNKLIYCKVQYAGGNDHTIPAMKGGVIIYETGMLQMANTSIENSGGYGLYVARATSVLTSGGGNAFTGNAMAPVTIPVSSLSYLDPNSDYSGNDADYIDCTDDGEVSGTKTWNNLGVPYLLPESIIRISGYLTIEAGTDIKARQGAGIQVTTSGALIAIGNAANRIVFEGNQPVNGYWAGIQVNSNNPSNKLDYSTVAYGGSSTSGFVVPIRMADIEINSTGSLTVNNSLIKNSNGFGINVIEGGIFYQASNTYSNNTVADTN